MAERSMSRVNMTLIEALEAENMVIDHIGHVLRARHTPQSLRILRRYAPGCYDIQLDDRGDSCYVIHYPESYYTPL